MAQLLSQTVWLIPVYALVGAILTALWFPGITRRTGPRPAGYLNALMSALALGHGLLAWPALWQRPALHLDFTWLQVAGLDLTLPVEISALSVGAIILICVINLLAQVYAIGYMEMDWGWGRLFSLLAFFEAGMCALVLCDSLFFSYIILEILTLATYLLIGFWFCQSLVVTGARDAFLTKRLGDLFLLMGVLALWPIAGTWDFTELAAWATSAAGREYALAHPTTLALVGLALIAGPMGKCAQFPFHLWLDEAMEGPIPSSVLRNSVVVAVGAWVLVKLEPVLALSPLAMQATVAIGAITALGGTLIALAQIDVKRTLSYPVSAYMGLVFVAVGTGQTQTALVLLLTHALAAALLMLTVGNFVWNNITQDVRAYGGLWARRPITGLCFLVGLAGLVALPPLGGFWALLDLIDGLWATRPWLVGLILVINGLAAFGQVRTFCLVFCGRPKPMTERSWELHWPFVLPTVVMAGFTLHLPLVLGYLGVLPTWAEVNTDLALLLVLSSMSGISLAALIYLSPAIPKPVAFPVPALQNLVAYDFYTPKLYRVTVVGLVDVISRLNNLVDQFLVDGAVNLVGLVTLWSGESLKYSSSGKFQLYILTMLLGLAGVALASFFLSH
ncbi:MAG: NAD(P)H-quinone oxidoreductase subunit F [Gloeomargaritaceae cyanobacterium C42_A2020_066]|nr:NAD(P)H-quinone oxidoreductase subunit F [Gloeomargaritaceae cyanobacterium C42_A2020_066]